MYFLTIECSEVRHHLLPSHNLDGTTLISSILGETFYENTLYMNPPYFICISLLLDYLFFFVSPSLPHPITTWVSSALSSFQKEISVIETLLFPNNILLYSQNKE